MNKLLLNTVVLLTIFLFPVALTAQTGGNFNIEQSVFSGGGGLSFSNGFSVTGTAGEPAAGTTSAGGTFSLFSGFWTSQPTINQGLTISGKVDHDGVAQISNVLMTLSGSASSSTFTDAQGNYSFANLPYGGNYTATPSLTDYTFIPKFRSTTFLDGNTTWNFTGFKQNCSYSIANSSNIVGSSSGSGTIQVTTGEECNWTALPNDSWISVASNSNNGSGGVSYTVDSNTGYARTGSVTIAGQNFTINQAPAPTLAQEGDISPRSTSGDGAINTNDLQQMRRYVNGLDQSFLSQSNIFQRTDISPRSTGGDGLINTNDLQQMRRYVNGVDPLRTVNGPVAPLAALAENVLSNTFSNTEKIAAGRVVRVVSQSSSAGQQVIVPINVDTEGDEAVYGFSVSYNPNVLTNPQVSIGDLGGTLSTNTSTAGQIGITVEGFQNGTIARVTNQTLVRITFTVATNAPAGPTPINFIDMPTMRNVAGDDPDTPLPQPSYENGQVVISGPTLALVSVSGKVILTKGKTSLFNSRNRAILRATVWYTDIQGQRRSAQTDERGYFRFGAVEAGYTYIFEAEAKGMQFAPQVITVNETIDNLSFLPLQ